MSVRVRTAGRWQSVVPRLWDGRRWRPVIPRRWDGRRWQPLTATAPAAVDPYPLTDDPIMMAMRPPHATVIHVHAGDDLRAAISAAAAARSIADHDHRILVILGPGTHAGPVPNVSFLSLVGATGDPRDVTILGSETDPQRGVLEAHSGIYVEALTIRRPATHAPENVYPVHGSQQGTRIFANAVLSTDSDFAIGLDGGSGGTTVVYRSHLDSGGSNAATNIHGPSCLADTPLVVAVVESTLTGVLKVAQHNPGGPGTGETWIIDSAMPGVTLDHVAHVSGGRPGAITAPTIDQESGWPVPRRGLGVYDYGRAYGT